MKLYWHDRARSEYEEAVDFYLEHAGPAIARDFAIALNEALRLLSEYPAIGMATDKRVRRIPLRGFPFNVVYRLQTDRLVVIALANQSRRPGYWGRRR